MKKPASVKPSVKSGVRKLYGDPFPRDKVRNAEEDGPRRKPGRPRDTTILRRLSFSVAEALATAKALESSKDPSAPRLREAFLAVAEAKRAEPHRGGVGRPTLAYSVEFADGSVEAMQGLKTVALRIGKSAGTIAVTMSHGNGVARFPCWYNGHPAETIVRKLTRTKQAESPE